MWYCQNNHTAKSYVELIQQYISAILYEKFFIIHSYHASRTWIVYINTQYFTNIFLIFIYLYYGWYRVQINVVCVFKVFRIFYILRLHKMLRVLTKLLNNINLLYTIIFFFDKEYYRDYIPEGRFIQSSIGNWWIFILRLVNV